MDSLWNYFSKIIIITIPNSDKDRIKKQLEYIGIIDYEIRVFQPAEKTENNSGGLHNITFKQVLCHNVCDNTCKNIAQNHFSIIEEAC